MVATLATFLFPFTGNEFSEWAFWKENHSPPQTWNSNYLPDIFQQGNWDGTAQQAKDRLYSSLDTYTLNRQIYLMEKAGIELVISSWWGLGSWTDSALSIIFNKVAPVFPSIKFCILYELDTYNIGTKDAPVWVDKTQANIEKDIDDLLSVYASSSSQYFYKINNKPVVFVYNVSRGTETDVQKADKWNAIRTSKNIYTVLKVFPAWETNSAKADSWYQLGPDVAFGEANDGVKKYSAYVSPGFYPVHGTKATWSRDLNAFDSNLNNLKNSTATDFKLIESWNNYYDGSMVEPAEPINHIEAGFTPIASSNWGMDYINKIFKYFPNNISHSTICIDNVCMQREGTSSECLEPGKLCVLPPIETKDNTGLYVGLAAVGILAAILLTRKKKKEKR